LVSVVLIAIGYFHAGKWELRRLLHVLQSIFIPYALCLQIKLL